MIREYQDSTELFKLAMGCPFEIRTEELDNYVVWMFSGQRVSKNMWHVQMNKHSFWKGCVYVKKNGTTRYKALCKQYDNKWMITMRCKIQKPCFCYLGIVYLLWFTFLIIYSLQLYLHFSQDVNNSTCLLQNWDWHKHAKR